MTQLDPKAQQIVCDWLDSFTSRIPVSAAAVDTLAAAIEAYALSRSAWIPCSERLPEERGAYLFLCPYGENEPGNYFITVHYFRDGAWMSGVTQEPMKCYWMPLPPPPAQLRRGKERG